MRKIFFFISVVQRQLYTLVLHIVNFYTLALLSVLNWAWLCLLLLASLLLMVLHCKKKISGFPVPRLDVTYQTFPGGA
jgi:hypothetical protein